MSELQVKTNKTVEAEVFLNCGVEEKQHNCRKLRDALLNQVSAVTLAETVEPQGTGKQFCVTGTAIVKQEEIKKFKKQMNQLKKSLKKAEGMDTESKVLFTKK